MANNNLHALPLANLDEDSKKRKREENLRTCKWNGVIDAICRGDREGSEIGGGIILPRTFNGGPRYMYSHYLDALAICRVLDRADVVVRVF
nr:DNA helicase [Tanacetum cinerariifolium]